MKKDLDEILKEKCRQVNTNYDFKVKNNLGKRKIVYKLVASFTALFLIVCSLYYTGLNDLENNYINCGGDNVTGLNIAEYEISEEVNQEVRGGESQGYLGLDQNETNVVIAKIDKILGYKNYSEKLDIYSYPITCIRAKVINSLRGDIKGTFDFYNLGGIISLEDYKKIVPKDKFKKIEDDLKSKKDKVDTHINLTFKSSVDIPKIELGHTYMLLLRYESELFDMYTTSGFVQGIFEYDIETNKIKDGTTGKWTEIDLSKF